MNAAVNPFAISGTVRECSFYVERDADEELVSTLDRGEYCYVFSPRQVGKSSLLFRAQQKLSELGYHCVGTELHGISSTPESIAGVYCALLDHICQELKLDGLYEYWDTNAQQDPARRFAMFLTNRVLPAVTKRLILFIDEVDSMGSERMRQLRNSFLPLIRSLYNARSQQPILDKLVVCLCGALSPSGLIDEGCMTPYNIGRSIAIKDFSRAEIGRFELPFDRLAIDKEELISALWENTEGHPNMCSSICHRIWNQLTGQSGGAQAGDTRVMVEEAARALFIDSSSNNPVNWARRMMSAENKNRTDLLLLYQDILQRGHSPARRETLDSLVLFGMVALRLTRDGERVEVRNRVFKQVFNQEWVEQELRKSLVMEAYLAWRNKEKSDRFLLNQKTLLRIRDKIEELSKEEQSFVLRSHEHHLKRSTRLLKQLRALGLTAAVILICTLLSYFVKKDDLKEIRALKQNNAKLQSETGDLNAHVFTLSKRNDAYLRTVNSLEQEGKKSKQKIEALKEENAAVRQNRNILKMENRALSREVDALAQENYELTQKRDLLTRHVITLTGQKDALEHQRAQLMHDGLLGVKDASMFFKSLHEYVNAVESVHEKAKGYQDLERRGRHNASSIDDLIESVTQVIALNNIKTLMHSLQGAWDIVDADLSLTDPSALKNALTSQRVDRLFLALLREPPTGLGKLHRLSNTPVRVSFVPKRRRLFTCEGRENSVIRIWDIANQKQPAIPSPRMVKGQGCTLAASDNGEWLLAGSAETSSVQVRHADSWALLGELPGHRGIVAAALSRDGRTAVIVDRNERVSLWTSQGGGAGWAPRGALEGHWGSITSLDISPDGRRIAIGGQNQSLQIWDAAARTVLWSAQHAGSVQSVRFSPDGTSVATASGDQHIRLFRADGGQEQRLSAADAVSLRGASFSLDGQRIIAPGSDGKIWVWDARTRKTIFAVPVSPGPLTSASFSPDGLLMAAGDEAGGIWILPSSLGGFRDAACARIRSALAQQPPLISRDADVDAALERCAPPLTRKTEP